MRRSELLASGLAATVALTLTAYACGGRRDAQAPAPPANDRAVSAIEPEEQSRCDFKGRTDREVVETATSRAVQPNMRRVYSIVGTGEEARRVLLCREVDTNLDGIKDVVRTYDDNGDALREMSDANFDGKMDTWTTFAAGRVAEVSVDRNRDGQPDEKRVYVGGKKLRAELDGNFDGKPDVWEVYGEGHLRRRGVDLTGDGHVDRWDRDEIAQRREDEEARQDEERGAATRPSAEPPEGPSGVDASDAGLEPDAQGDRSRDAGAKDAGRADAARND